KSMIASAEWRGPKMNSFLGIIRANQDIIGTLIYGGVFERHPDLRVVCVEADAGWAPHYMYRMDHAYKRHPHWLESGALSGERPGGGRVRRRAGQAGRGSGGRRGRVEAALGLLHARPAVAERGVACL